MVDRRSTKREVVRLDKMASDDERVDECRMLFLHRFEKKIVVMSEGGEPFFQAKCEAETVRFFLRAGEERGDFICVHKPVVVLLKPQDESLLRI